MMDELNKKIHILKQKMRMAINESGLALGVVELALDSLRAEVMQQELFMANNELANQQEKPVESEVEPNGVHEDDMGK
jgi:hypothetical protein